MRKLSYLIVVLALLAAACGGGTEATGTTSSPATTTTSAPQTTTTPQATTTTPEATTTATVAAGTGPLQAALRRTSTVTSGRMEGSFSMVANPGDPSGTTMSIGFTGAFDTTNGTSSFTMDLGDALAGLPGAAETPAGLGDLFGKMEVRTIGDTTYMQFPLFSTMLGVDTEWISLPTNEAGAATTGFGPSPANPADLLAAFGDITAAAKDLGREQVRGVETTHFRLNVDIDAMTAAADDAAKTQLDGLGAVPGGGVMPVDFWIGDDGLVRRFSFTTNGPIGDTAGTNPGLESMTVVWELYDYGADVAIVAPPADQVSDGSALTSLFGP